MDIPYTVFNKIKWKWEMKQKYEEWKERTRSIISYNYYLKQYKLNNWDESKILVKKDPDLE